jgi:DNA-binding beta-propeller fold protein YncE
VLTPGSGVTVRHLNTPIDYGTCCASIPNAENAKSLALPQGMVVTSNGQERYVAALGSGKIGVLQTADLADHTFVPSTAHQIPVTGGGPSGLVVDEVRQRLYVLTRFDHAIALIDTATKTETHHLAMPNPEPSSMTVGRRFL